MERFKKLGKVSIIIMALAAFTMPVFVSAVVTADTPVHIAQFDNPEPPIAGAAIDLQEVEDLIRRAAQFLIVVGVIIAVIYIIAGGIRWIISAGNPEKVKAARGMVLHGAIGAAVILGVGVILQTVAILVTRSFFN